MLDWWGWRESAGETDGPMPPEKNWVLDTRLERWRARVTLRHLPLTSGMTVADIGSGPGRLTIPLADRVGPDGRVVAVDIQQEMLDAVRKAADAAGRSSVETVRCDIGTGPLELEAVDHALMVSVLGEVPRENRPSAVRRVHDVLSPGGLLLVKEDFLDPDYLGPRTVHRLGRGAGFTVRSTHRAPLAHTTLFQKPSRG